MHTHPANREQYILCLCWCKFIAECHLQHGGCIERLQHHVFCNTGLEGRRVSLQRRTSSIERKPSTLTDMLPSFDETRGRKQKHVLPAIQQPNELSVPLKEATATAKSSQQMQQIFM